MAEISSTETQSHDRMLFDTNVANKSQISLSPFTEKTVSPFTLAAKPNVSTLSPKKSPAALGISRTSSGISDARNFSVDRHIGAGSSFMKSGHISQLNFNSVSTTSVSDSNTELSSRWRNSFTEARTTGVGATLPPAPSASFTSSANSIQEEMSPPILKPKVRRTSSHTPEKSPLVTSSSGEALELGKPSDGLGQPPGFTSSDAVDFETRLSHNLAMSSPRLNLTPRQFSTSSTDNDLDEQSLYNQVPISSAAKTKQSSSLARSDSYSSIGSDHRNSHAVSKPFGKEKSMPKSRSRPAKQKMKSPLTDEDYERQRSEMDNAFEAACRLPSTVRGQPSNSMNRWSTFGSQKVSCASFGFCCDRLNWRFSSLAH